MKSKSRRKLFTLQEANATLPLVKAITSDLFKLSHDVWERRQRIESLTAGRELNASDPYTAELAERERDLERDMETLRAYVAELEALGVESKGALEGLVDFPARIDGRDVYLCWRLGEPEISHWHEIDAGFAGRQRLVPEPTQA